jgi:hypothetical protein
MTLLYCPRLSRCCVTRRQTAHPKPELTSKTCLMAFFTK